MKTKIVEVRIARGYEKASTYVPGNPKAPISFDVIQIVLENGKRYFLPNYKIVAREPYGFYAVARYNADSLFPKVVARGFADLDNWFEIAELADGPEKAEDLDITQAEARFTLS